jgi:hypothetical protein
MTTAGKFNGSVKWVAGLVALGVAIGAASYSMGTLERQVSQNTGDIDELKICITRIDRLTVGIAATMGVSVDD